MDIGDKVICINDSGLRRIAEDFPGALIPYKGEEYVIREIMRYHDRAGITLEELRNGRYEIGNLYTEPAFNINRFRRIEHHTFTNELTEELAEKATAPLEVELIE